MALIIDGKELKSASEAADFLGVSQRRVAQYRTHGSPYGGKLKAVRIGRDWFYSVEELERYKSIARPVGQPVGTQRKRKELKPPTPA